MLFEMRVLAEADGFQRLVQSVRNRSAIGRFGRLYNLQAAADLATQSPGANIEFVEKWVDDIDPNTGEIIKNATDIDFIIDDGATSVYYQAKSTRLAFGRTAEEALADAKRWVRLAQRDAVANGISNQIIKYVVPTEDIVWPSVKEYLDGLTPTIEIVISAPN
jgi:hypothetical protein